MSGAGNRCWNSKQKRGIDMQTMLTANLAYEFLPTADQSILEIDSILEDL